ncbi:hypothetical protein H2248_009761 [Termitomyces sp. 'cryptogamus']|nr:hypothetical protein H2248_009761 [Termitomyces sp. 'cryptogamus']
MSHGILHVYGLEQSSNPLYPSTVISDHQGHKTFTSLMTCLENAAGVILSIPAFLSPVSNGYEWYKSFYGQWMLISFVWVPETKTGATVSIPIHLICSTT